MTIRARFKVPKLAAAVDGNWVLRFVPVNLQGAIAIPPAPKRAFPLALPAFPTTYFYSAEVQWPQNVSAVNDPTVQRFGNAAFNAEVSRSFRGNVARASLRFEPLTNAVAAKDVPTMVEDAQKMQRALGNAMTVGANQVKDGGFLGIGRKTLQDNLRASAQSAVDRTSKVIAAGQIAGDDLAQTLCIRSQAYTELGDSAAALKDAQEAARQAPSLGLAWFCQGNAEWAHGDFAPATASFGKALALGLNPADVYYRRGQARFYDGKLDQAADDFAKAVVDRKEPNDKLYAMLWQAWTLQRLGRPLPADLSALAAADPKGEWPRPALALFTGQMSPEQVIEQASRKTGDERDLTLTEGWFYVGEYHLLRSQPDKAREAFEKARAQGITKYIEHGAAGFELQRLGTKP
jgi:lipoprotein NlpI